MAIASAAPHRRLVVADGSDHDVPEKRPEAIVEAVLSLTAQLTTGLHDGGRKPADYSSLTIQSPRK
jgi:hypothetical protein